MTRTMSISFLLTSTENIWGKCENITTLVSPPTSSLTSLKHLNTTEITFCSFSNSRKPHGVGHNGLSLETPEYGIVNYNEWMDNVSRYLLFSTSILITDAVVVGLEGKKYLIVVKKL